MFIAHIPVGLALARVIGRKPLTLPIAGVAMLGAIFPDLDLIRFYIFDHHQRHHHDYWTHIPLVWAGLMVAWFVLMKLIKRRFGVLPLVFFASVFSHLILDSLAGEIEWLWPVLDQGFHLVTVPTIHSKWYVSFLVHWTFAVEILLSLMALRIALKDKKT